MLYSYDGNFFSEVLVTERNVEDIEVGSMFMGDGLESVSMNCG